MSECHRLGIKNFKSLRHSGRIKLAFNLCNDDTSAPRYVSSKGDDYHEKIESSDLDYFTIKKSVNNWSRRYQYFKISVNFILNILCLIYQVLCIILQYAICLIRCLFKIFRCTIFRGLTESISFHSKGLICHPCRCHHH